MFCTLSRSSKSVLYLSWIWFLPVRNVRYIQKCLSVFAAQSLSCVWLWDLMQHTMLPCPSLSPWVCSNSGPDIHPSISSFVIPFSCLQSFPESRSFPMSWLFASGGQSIGVSTSASVLPMNIQGWFPLWLTGLISLLSKGLSRVFSSTTVWKYQFSTLSFLYGPPLTSVHDYWKNHSFAYTNLCLQNDISAF